MPEDAKALHHIGHAQCCLQGYQLKLDLGVRLGLCLVTISHCLDGTGLDGVVALQHLPTAATHNHAWGVQGAMAASAHACHMHMASHFTATPAMQGMQVEHSHLDEHEACAKSL